MKTNQFFKLLMAASAALAATVAAPPPVQARPSNALSQLALIQDVRHEIVKTYVEESDQDELIQAAVRAMVDSLDDPFTVYLTPQELEPLDEQVHGRFTGIGVEYTIDKILRRMRVLIPLEDSPAWQAGVMAGDVVLEIDGVDTEGMEEREARKRLMGPADTKVTIKVRHESGEEQDITITRAVINVKSVRGFRRDKDNRPVYLLDQANGIGYVKIRQFTDRTADELREALDDLSKQKVHGLILDLRFNPGGLLEAAIAVSDMFLDVGKTIVSVKGRTVPKRVEKSTATGTFAPVPMVVLANEGSASAAEIVTGALTDNGRAKFIGMRTFGKSSVQPVRWLESGGAIKITTAYYYLPGGRLIHRKQDSEVWGVDPEDGFFVPMTREQLTEMVKRRVNSDVLRQYEGNVTPDWIRDELGDIQLAAALRALLGKLETDQWQPVGESGAKLIAAQRKRENLQRQRDLIKERLTQVEQELAKLEAGQDTGEGDDTEQD